MTNYRSNLEEYSLYYIGQTDKGLHVRQDENHPSFWLPKSQVEFEDKEYKRHAVVTVTMPQWLAEKHDLL